MLNKPVTPAYAGLLLLLLLSGCSGMKTTDESAPVETSPGPTAIEPGASKTETHRPASPSASAAWQPLLEKAKAASDRGDYEQAFAYLERAQRIDPDSAEVYLGMARTHQAKGDMARARATAERGLLYCSTGRLCDALRAFTR